LRFSKSENQKIRKLEDQRIRDQKIRDQRIRESEIRKSENQRLRGSEDQKIRKSEVWGCAFGFDPTRRVWRIGVQGCADYELIATRQRMRPSTSSGETKWECEM